MSLSTRLNLFYIGLLAVALTIFGVAFYAALSQSLLNDTDTALRHLTTEVHRALGAGGGDFATDHITVASLDALPIDEFASPGVYVQILDTRGLVVASSSNLRGSQLPVDPVVIDAGLAGRETLVSLAAGGGERVRVHTTPIRVQGKAAGVVQVAQSLHATDVALRQAGTILAAATLGVIVCAALAGFVVTGRALAPLNRIAGLAEQITGAADLSQRITLGDRRDEIGRLAGSFNRMMSRLDTAFRSQELFVAGAAHELRSPITVIRGNLDLLKRRLDPRGRQEAMADIESETLRMSRLVDDLLSLAQLGAPRPAVHQPVEIAGLIADVVRQSQLVDAGRHTISIEAEAAAVIQGDRQRLREMLTNLVENARRYTPDGGRVTVTSEIMNSAGLLEAPPASASAAREYLRIAVTDTGIGIDAESLARIFEPFYRADKAHTRVPGGAGLGLAIVRGIAEQHGGWVAVESEPGKGSTFTAWLPML